MKSAVTIAFGSPEVIQIQDLPIPKAKPETILIKIMAFGLNRSELFTRRGDSPGVKTPIIQGIECVGIVEEDPSGKLDKGQKVVALMGGMGRFINGGYAEYTLVPSHIVFPFESDLPWDVLGATPEMYQTVAGSLFNALDIQKGETLLIRGGTSSIGLLACKLAKAKGLKVVSTTRDIKKKGFLESSGADEVIIDHGDINKSINNFPPYGVDKVLELVGTRTLKDSLKCIRKGGTVCMTGILGNEWDMQNFTPMGDIPSLGKLTVYMGEAEDLDPIQYQSLLDMIANKEIEINIDRTFKLEEIVQAHQYMEDNKAKGKIVVLP